MKDGGEKEGERGDRGGLKDMGSVLRRWLVSCPRKETKGKSTQKELVTKTETSRAANKTHRSIKKEYVS